MLEWIHKWKRNGWKNSKKQRVANAALWRELDSAISLHARVEFTWVKAHSGILLNEWAGQLATRAIGGSSYSTEVPIQTDDVESSE
jgi:ribonuclease HI